MDPALARVNVFDLPLPYVLGFDFSGEVVRLGDEDKDELKMQQSKSLTVFGKGQPCYCPPNVAIFL
jgi:NADPH:quinone reductase-like Zn-dependent oxidoreductase